MMVRSMMQTGSRAQASAHCIRQMLRAWRARGDDKHSSMPQALVKTKTGCGSHHMCELPTCIPQCMWGRALAAARRCVVRTGGVNACKPLGHQDLTALDVQACKASIH